MKGLSKFVINIDDGHLKLNVHFFYKQPGSGLSPQICLMVAKCLINVLEGHSNSQDAKSISMASDFKIFEIMLLRQLNCSVFWV